MFKSIFSKYLFTFTVILVCCIMAILLAVSSRLSNEAYAVKRETMSVSAGSTAMIAENYIRENGYNSIYEVFSDGGEFDELFDFYSASSSAEIYLFDDNGLLVGCSDESYANGEYRLSSNAVKVMLSMRKNFSVSTVEGFFSTNRLNEYYVTRVGNRSVIVLASIENYGNVVFTTEIFIATTTVALWVFLAAMISLYVISRKTTQPLSQIVTAAKSYAKGRFDQRIEVVGQDEVAELAEAINDMAASLKRIDEERNSFLGNVSHDLRTPMTTIAGFVEGIMDGTIPPEKHEYYLNIISQEVRRLSRLVNTLLEVSRMESGADLRFSDFNLSETARMVLISLESKISRKNIDIEFDSGESDVYVNADPDSIHRVIFNLMDNAVKFTPDGGKISITLRMTADGKKKRKALFKIRNTGEGITRDELPHVFDRFYKTDRSRGLDKSGTGLGLYIAKTSITNHGEEITVDSVEGEYTEFEFTLPPAVIEVLPRRNND